MAVAISSNVTYYLAESLVSLDRKAFLNGLAAKVSMVAVCAIYTLVTTISILGTGFLTTPLIIGSVGLLLLSPILFHIERIFAHRAQTAREQAKIERTINDHQKLLSSWKADNFTAFFKEHNIHRPYDPSLLPFIARFIYFKQTAENYLAEANLYLDPKLPNSKLKELSGEVRYLARQAGWNLLANGALPAKLQSAVMLQLIEHPDQIVNLDNIGRAAPLPFAQYLSEKIYDGTEPYFIFKDNRPPLTVTDIEDRSPSDLKKSIFGDQMNALSANFQAHWNAANASLQPPGTDHHQARC